MNQCPFCSSFHGEIYQRFANFSCPEIISKTDCVDFLNSVKFEIKEGNWLEVYCFVSTIIKQEKFYNSNNYSANQFWLLCTALKKIMRTNPNMSSVENLEKINNDFIFKSSIRKDVDKINDDLLNKDLDREDLDSEDLDREDLDNEELHSEDIYQEDSNKKITNDKLKNIIFKKLYKDLSKVEIIPYGDSIYFIARDEKYWYFEYQKSGTLWWDYYYFSNFFVLFSLEREEYEKKIGRAHV